MEEVLDAIMPHRIPGDTERLRTLLNDEANDPTSTTFISITQEKEAVEHVDLQSKVL